MTCGPGCIHNVFDFGGAVFGIERDARPTQRAFVELLSHRLFRASPRGLGIAALDRAGNFLRGEDHHEPVWGIAVTGIVEGTDIEASEKLMFPLTAEQFWNVAQRVNDALDEAEAEWEVQGDAE